MKYFQNIDYKTINVILLHKWYVLINKWRYFYLKKIPIFVKSDFFRPNPQTQYFQTADYQEIKVVVF
ncbi:hypothetical protein [Lutibacter sp.]|uniref:hypothetical protein n=1 Tax=Lutibacter sp. TaxID=1925666 RepID=UPI0035680EBD